MLHATHNLHEGLMYLLGLSEGTQLRLKAALGPQHPSTRALADAVASIKRALELLDQGPPTP